MNFDYKEELEKISELSSKEIACKIELLEQELSREEQELYKNRGSDKADKNQESHVYRLRSIIYDLEDSRRRKEIEENIKSSKRSSRNSMIASFVVAIILTVYVIISLYCAIFVSTP